ncbi:hypothetical protein [Mycoplasma wenyonii]|uniref:hypothetical protein n=1 Tax=Mycoplasma wenyonii TaxID=65123 RepID=UPI000DD6A3E5|nr:hypothetical protein [Mycoplasma wenyonii]
MGKSGNEQIQSFKCFFLAVAPNLALTQLSSWDSASPTVALNNLVRVGYLGPKKKSHLRARVVVPATNPPPVTIDYKFLYRKWYHYLNSDLWVLRFYFGLFLGQSYNQVVNFLYVFSSLKNNFSNGSCSCGWNCYSLSINFYIQK